MPRFRHLHLRLLAMCLALAVLGAQVARAATDDEDSGKSKKSRKTASSSEKEKTSDETPKKKKRSEPEPEKTTTKTSKDSGKTTDKKLAGKDSEKSAPKSDKSASSSTRFRGTTLELLSGSTEVQGRESIAAGAYKISPAGESRFTVQHELTTIVLRLLRGSVELSRGHEVKMITNPGEYTLQDNAPAPAIKPHRITKALPIAAGAAAGTAVVISHWLTGKEAATSTSCVSGKSPTSCK